jgi:hypothetical protein
MGPSRAVKISWRPGSWQGCFSQGIAPIGPPEALDQARLAQGHQELFQIMLWYLLGFRDILNLDRADLDSAWSSSIMA